MSRLFTTFAALGLALLLSTNAFAQVKTIQGEMIVKTATIEAIDHNTRDVTIKEEDGTYTTISVPATVTRFKDLKVGDTITARYYDNVVLRVKLPGEKDVDSTKDAETRTAGRPGGTVAEQRTITATITHIDRNVPSITYSGPNNWKYSSRVVDKKALDTVKVGDKVDITWTQAVLVDVGPAVNKKK